MKTNTILSYIAQSQRRRLIYPLLLLSTVVFLITRTPVSGYLNMDTLKNDQPVTFSVARKSLYARAPVSRLCYTGEDYWLNGQLTGHYYYSLQGDVCQFYVIKASAGVPAAPVLENAVVTGRIDAFGEELKSLADSMAHTLDWTASGIINASSSYYINATVYLNKREIFLMAVLILAFLFAVSALIRLVIYWWNPRLTPACRRLKKYGEPELILQDAQRQLARQIRTRTKDMVLTPDYLIEFSGDVSAVIPLQSILWTYDHAALHYTLRGKQLSYTIHVVTVYGDEYNLKQKTAEDVQVIYNELTSRYPNYFYGYSKEHLKMVKHLIKEMKAEQQT